jgi:nicotinate-nucleotide pyrophosphorylase (carboxylating)
MGQGDVTTSLIVPEGTTVEAEVVTNESGVAAGLEEAKALLESLGLNVKAVVTDGEKIKRSQVLLRISGDARTVLSVERTLLNVLSRMSGIATTTRKLVEKIHKAGLETRVACTRKTAPGLLYFDKKAVLIGGGDPHRFHLDDMILIKDNHIAIAGSVEKAIKKAKEKALFSKKIEIEITNGKDAVIAARTEADIIMLDNFSPKQIETVANTLKKAGLPKKVLLEASGGITAENVLAYASTGVDIVSLGEITYSTKTLDINLEITKVHKKFEAQ